jgi:mersacidin/lichenicidin family type 2 lantibiotic
MSKLDVIRAWKDEEYRLSLDETERTLLPANPAGLVELTDADLDQAAGGGNSHDSFSNDSFSNDSFSFGHHRRHHKCW